MFRRGAKDWTTFSLSSEASEFHEGEARIKSPQVQPRSGRDTKDTYIPVPLSSPANLGE